MTFVVRRRVLFVVCRLLVLLFVVSVCSCLYLFVDRCLLLVVVLVAVNCSLFVVCRC